MRVEITAGRQPTHNAHFPATTVHYRINEVFRKLTLQPDEDIAAVWKHFYSQTKDLISGSGAWCVTGQTAGSQPVRATALLQHFPGGRHVGTGIAEGLLAGASLSELSSMVGAVRGFDDFNSKELLLDAVLAWELSPPDLYQWPALAKGSVPVLRNMKDLSADNDIDRLGQLVQIGTTVAPSLAVQPLFEVTFSLCEYRMYINCSLGRPCRLRWRSALWKANGRLAALACLKAQFLKYQALPLPDEINKAAITQALAEAATGMLPLWRLYDQCVQADTTCTECSQKYCYHRRTHKLRSLRLTRSCKAKFTINAKAASREVEGGPRCSGKIRRKARTTM